MRLKRSASNGSGATILAGVTIGECALIGAVAGVTDDVPDHHIARRVPGWTGRSVLEKQL
jgi:acetyltransferase-like isoleucine patch superfamily enzyme